MEYNSHIFNSDSLYHILQTYICLLTLKCTYFQHCIYTWLHMFNPVYMHSYEIANPHFDEIFNTVFVSQHISSIMIACHHINSSPSVGCPAWLVFATDTHIRNVEGSNQKTWDPHPYTSVLLKKCVPIRINLISNGKKIGDIRTPPQSVR